MNEESRVANKIDLKPIAKEWVKFFKSRLMPTTHIITVSQDRLILLNVIVNGLAIDVRKVIEKEIIKCAFKKQKTIALLFPSLITGIYEAFRVKFEAKDERVKNDGAIIARTVERLVVETTAATTWNHPAAGPAEQATGIEHILEELSDSTNACVQAQKKNI